MSLSPSDCQEENSPSVQDRGTMIEVEVRPGYPRSGDLVFRRESSWTFKKGTRLRRPNLPAYRKVSAVKPALPLSKDASATPESSEIVSKLNSRPLPPLPDDSTEQTMAVNNSNAFPPLDNPMSPTNRSPASNASAQVNGNGASYSNNYLPPLPVGQQQDLTFLYQQIQELSSILQSNRERVDDVTRSAEEVARRANVPNGHSSDDQSANRERMQKFSGQETDFETEARIRELERELADANTLIDQYKHEQKENTALIGQYEQGMWHATEQIRDYSAKHEDRYLAQKRHYNSLLQAEKDEHHETRLDRDHWQQQTLRLCEMLRTAYRLRVDEWCDEYRAIVGLQSEVRCYRRLLNMEAEQPEEETGWPYLKDAPTNDGK